MRGRIATGEALRVTQISRAAKSSAVTFVVEDDRGDCVPLTLYNALGPTCTLAEAQAHFRAGKG